MMVVTHLLPSQEPSEGVMTIVLLTLRQNVILEEEAKCSMHRIICIDPQEPGWLNEAG